MVSFDGAADGKKQLHLETDGGSFRPELRLTASLKRRESGGTSVKSQFQIHGTFKSGRVDDVSRRQSLSFPRSQL